MTKKFTLKKKNPMNGYIAWDKRRRFFQRIKNVRRANKRNSYLLLFPILQICIASFYFYFLFFFANYYYYYLSYLRLLRGWSAEQHDGKIKIKKKERKKKRLGRCHLWWFEFIIIVNQKGFLVGPTKVCFKWPAGPTSNKAI